MTGCQLVRNWMTPDPITITSNTTLPEAHRLMEQHAIRRLPVVDEGKLIGIVTLSDVREASPSEAMSLCTFELNYLLLELQVGKIMTPDPVTIAPDATVAQAARLMLEREISCLPVMEGDKLVGIITESDIFRMLVTDRAA